MKAVNSGPTTIHGFAMPGTEEDLTWKVFSAHSASSSLWVWASGKEELTGLAMWIGAGYIRRLWMEALVGRGELILDPHLGISSSTYSGHSSEERLTESMQRSYRPSHKHQQNQNGSLLSMRSLATDA